MLGAIASNCGNIADILSLLGTAGEVLGDPVGTASDLLGVPFGGLSAVGEVLIKHWKMPEIIYLSIQQTY